MVEIDRQKLVDVLRSVASVVESDNPISVLQRLCFRDGMVCGSDGTLSIIASCDVNESFCVDAKSLLQLHSRLDSEKVSWAFANNKLTVKSGRHKSEFLTSDAKSYPNHLPSGTVTLNANPKGFAAAIKQCLAFTDDSKTPQLNGIGCKGEFVYGVDEVECVRAKIEGAFSETISIPRNAARVICGLGDPAKLLLTPSKSSIVLLYTGKVVVCRLLEAKMPFAAIDSIFAPDDSHAVPLPGKDLAAAVSRVALILKQGGIKLKSVNGVLTISAEQESGGSSQEELALVGVPDFECKLHAGHFSKAASSFERLDVGDLIVGAKRYVRFLDPSSRYAMGLMS